MGFWPLRLIYNYLSSYTKWIAGIAKVDSRLLATLRLIRSGEFVYGKDLGRTPPLESLCEEIGLPKTCGNPATTERVPCKVCPRSTQ